MQIVDIMLISDPVQSLKREVMVVKKDILLKGKYFNGFIPAEKFDFESVILKNFEFRDRDEIENNQEYKQPIGYSLIINPYLERVYVYQRAKEDPSYEEKRLQGKFSIGIGGHIEKFDGKNPIDSGIKREIEEEVDLKTIHKIKRLGYINLDDNDVGKVHFGVLYLILTPQVFLAPKDKEIIRGDFIGLKDLEIMLNENDFEDWSRISFKALKKYRRNFPADLLEIHNISHNIKD